MESLTRLLRHIEVAQHSAYAYEQRHQTYHDPESGLRQYSGYKQSYSHRHQRNGCVEFTGIAHRVFTFLLALRHIELLRQWVIALDSFFNNLVAGTVAPVAVDKRYYHNRHDRYTGQTEYIKQYHKYRPGVARQLPHLPLLAGKLIGLAYQVGDSVCFSVIYQVPHTILDGDLRRHQRLTFLKVPCVIGIRHNSRRVDSQLNGLHAGIDTHLYRSYGFATFSYRICVNGDCCIHSLSDGAYAYPDKRNNK